VLAGRLAALAALAIIVGAGGAYVADSNAGAKARHLLQPPLPGPVRPYIAEATQLTTSEPPTASPEKLIALAQDILRRAPLSASPFILASDARVAEGDPDAARDLALVALQRDPRNARLQLQLANDAAQRGNLAEALNRLSVLMTIDARNGGAYLGSMARIAGVPDGPGLIERELAGAPRWGVRLVNLLTPHHPDLAFLSRLVRIFPEARDGYVSRLVRERGARAAHAEWAGMLAAQDKSKVADTPFNPSFDPELLASPPFNWRISKASAELNKKGGLYASYEGRGKVVLVEQLMILPAGTYRLSVEASVSRRPKGGSLAWTLRCGAGPSDLTHLALTDTSYGRTDFQAAFEVPLTECDNQFLRLVGEPAEFTTGATAEIGKVLVTPTQSASAP